jgi:hypothetical protein
MNSRIRELLNKLKINAIGDDFRAIRDELEGDWEYCLSDLASRHSGFRMYPVSGEPDRFLACARYGNANGFAFAVVASVMFHENGDLLDWAAYWGGCDLTQRKEDAVRWVHHHGNKLSLDDAQHYFPDIPIVYYRE